MRRPLVIGHRANTERWLRKHLEAGADGIEVDVRLSGEGLSLGHPPPGIRPATVRERIASILTSFHILRPLSLEEILYLLGERILWLDLKDRGICSRIRDLCSDILDERNLVLSTKHHIEARSAREIFPDARVFVSLSSAPADPVAVVESSRADGISLEITYATGELADALRSSGYSLALWTVNDEGQVARSLELGASFIVTDDVQLVRRALDRL